MEEVCFRGFFFFFFFWRGERERERRGRERDVGEREEKRSGWMGILLGGF